MCNQLKKIMQNILEFVIYSILIIQFILFVLYFSIYLPTVTGGSYGKILSLGEYYQVKLQHIILFNGHMKHIPQSKLKATLELIL